MPLRTDEGLFLLLVWEVLGVLCVFSPDTVRGGAGLWELGLEPAAPRSDSRGVGGTKDVAVGRGGALRAAQCAQQRPVLGPRRGYFDLVPVSRRWKASRWARSLKTHFL